MPFHGWGFVFMICFTNIFHRHFSCWRITASERHANMSQTCHVTLKCKALGRQERRIQSTRLRSQLRPTCCLFILCCLYKTSELATYNRISTFNPDQNRTWNLKLPLQPIWPYENQNYAERTTSSTTNSTRLTNPALWLTQKDILSWRE